MLNETDLNVIRKAQTMDMAAVEKDPGIAFDLLAIIVELRLQVQELQAKLDNRKESK